MRRAWTGPTDQRIITIRGSKTFLLRRQEFGVPVMAQWLTNPTRNHEVAGSVPALAQWVKDPVLP